MLGQNGTHGLDTPAQPGPTAGADNLMVLVFGAEPDYRLPGRSSSAPRVTGSALLRGYPDVAYSGLLAVVTRQWRTRSSSCFGTASSRSAACV